MSATELPQWEPTHKAACPMCGHIDDTPEYQENISPAEQAARDVINASLERLGNFVKEFQDSARQLVEAVVEKEKEIYGADAGVEEVH